MLFVRSFNSSTDKGKRASGGEFGLEPLEPRAHCSVSSVIPAVTSAWFGKSLAAVDSHVMSVVQAEVLPAVKDNIHANRARLGELPAVLTTAITTAGTTTAGTTTGVTSSVVFVQESETPTPSLGPPIATGLIAPNLNIPAYQFIDWQQNTPAPFTVSTVSDFWPPTPSMTVNSAVMFAATGRVIVQHGGISIQRLIFPPEMRSVPVTPSVPSNPGGVESLPESPSPDHKPATSPGVVATVLADRGESDPLVPARAASADVVGQARAVSDRAATVALPANPHAAAPLGLVSDALFWCTVTGQGVVVGAAPRGHVEAPATVGMSATVAADAVITSPGVSSMTRRFFDIARLGTPFTFLNDQIAAFVDESTSIPAALIHEPAQHPWGLTVTVVAVDLLLFAYTFRRGPEKHQGPMHR